MTHDEEPTICAKWAPLTLMLYFFKYLDTVNNELRGKNTFTFTIKGAIDV